MRYALLAALATTILLGQAQASNLWFSPTNVTYIGQTTKKFPALVIGTTTITYDRFQMINPENGETCMVDYALSPQPGGVSLAGKQSLALYNVSYNNLGEWLMSGWDINELRAEAGLLSTPNAHYGFWIDANNDGDLNWVNFIETHGNSMSNEYDTDYLLYFNAGQKCLGRLDIYSWSAPSLLQGGIPSSDPNLVSGTPFIKFSVPGQKDRYGHYNSSWYQVDHSPYVLSASGATFVVFFDQVTEP